MTIADGKPPTGPCVRCGAHEASLWWIGSGDMIHSYGLEQAWCQCCSVRKQIEYLQTQLARLPGLMDQLLAECPVALDRAANRPDDIGTPPG